MQATPVQVQFSQKLSTMGIPHTLVPPANCIIATTAQGYKVYRCDEKKGLVIVWQEPNASIYYIGDIYAKVFMQGSVIVLDLTTMEWAGVEAGVDVIYEGYKTATFVGKDKKVTAVCDLSSDSVEYANSRGTRRVIRLGYILILHDPIYGTLRICNLRTHEIKVLEFRGVICVKNKVFLYDAPKMEYKKWGTKFGCIIQINDMLTSIEEINIEAMALKSLVVPMIIDGEVIANAGEPWIDMSGVMGGGVSMKINAPILFRWESSKGEIYRSSNGESLNML